MAKRSFSFTRHDGRTTRVFMSGPDLIAPSPAESLGRFAQKNGRRAGVGLAIAGVASFFAFNGPKREEGPAIETGIETNIGTQLRTPEVVAGDGLAGIETVTEDRTLRAPRVAPLLAEPAEISRALPVIAPPPVLADAENGPFRQGMRTGFNNNPVLTGAMAENMNIAFTQFRSHGFTEQASLAFTLQGVDESLAGTTLNGTGDSVGYFQFSKWDGNGVGAEIAALAKPGADRNWGPADFTGADSATAIRNAADATAQLLAEAPDYAGLNTLVRDPDASAADLARATTRDFMRPTGTVADRMAEIATTLERNQVALRSNIDAQTPAAASLADRPLDRRATP